MQTRLHAAVPDDWWIVIADVIGSTGAIEAGEYKKVNTVGVACIAAVTNVDRNVDIPFMFGGDGATFAIPDILMEPVKAALRATQKLSREGFGLDLRAGLVRVADLRESGSWVNLAKVRLSAHAVQATFSGRGWGEAERRVKCAENVRMVSDAQGEAEASFEGFECRWQSVPSFNGHKLSLLVAAMDEEPAVNLRIYEEVIATISDIYGEVAQYHPLRPQQMQLTLNPKLLSHEFRVRAGSSKWQLCHFARMLIMNLSGMYLFARNMDTETVKWSRYRNDLVDNTDFRKFDGIMRMVIDGSEEQKEKLEAFLERRYREGRLVYGTYRSKEALVTCLVQSYSGNHMHFVDGSDGGYAMASIPFKCRIAQLRDSQAPRTRP